VHLPTRFVLMAAMMAVPLFLMAQEAAPVSAPAPSPLPVRPLRLPGTAFASAPAASPQLQAPQPLQAAPSQPPGTPAPIAQPVAQPLRSLPAMGDNEVIPTIDFPNSDIRSILPFYEKLTGKKALFDSTVQGNIQVSVLKPVTRLEAIRILETVFTLNGFTLIPGPGDIVKVIGQTKNVRQFSIPIFSEPEQLPESNQVVTFLFKLDYADPAEVKTALDQVMAPTPNVTNVVALAKSQAVLVTENSDVIRNLLQIVAKLDSKPAEVVSEFFTLERADAKDVVERLSKMFEKTPNASGATPGNVPAPNRPQVPGGAIQDAAAGTSTSVTLSEDSLIVGKIKIEADTRTNRVHVVTRPINLPFLRTLIGELDSGQPLGEPATRALRFVLAGDVLDIVAGSVAEPGVEVKNIGGGGSSSGAAKPTSDTSSNFGTSGTSSRSSSRSSSLSSGSFGANNSNAQADNAPEARLIRNTKIIADNRINAIIVVGSDEMKSKVFKLLDEIDVRAPQVMLTAVIGELTLDNTEQFGVDYLLHTGSLTSTQITNLGLSSTSSGIDRLSGNSLKNIAAVATSSASGGGLSGVIGVSNSLDMIVTALESTGRFRATSRPMIFTSNNRRAVISSGESIAVPSSTTSAYTTGTNLTSTSSIEYIDVALKLSVLPLINSDGEVTLQITQEANNTNGTTTISGNAIPNVTTRSIDTTVSVANGATIVLGGLVSSQKTVNNNGIPGLMHLPLVGPLFSYKSTVTKRTELVVLIRPTVTRNPVEAVRTGEKTLEKTNFKPDLDATLDPPATPAANSKKGAFLKRFISPDADLRNDD
jgi:type II secretion system protein D